MFALLFIPLSHPNIVPLHAFGEVEGMPYFVMGYVRGESLSARLQRDGKMNEEDGLRLLAEVADALDHAHSQTILRHGDELPGPLRPLGTEAGVAARQVLTSIEEIGREIAELARSLEHAEEERLAEKIDTLGEDAAPLRSILLKELELVRGPSERIEEAREIRRRRKEMLRTLSDHLASLRLRAVGLSDTSGLTDRVRALCSDIAAHAAPGMASPAIESDKAVRA